MKTLRNLVTPPPLCSGDTIALVSPATVIKPEYVEGAVASLRSCGFNVKVMPHALGPSDGSYAASTAARLADFTGAYSDPQVRAILCARGGYGCIHLIDSIDPAMLAADPKWVVGFSDVSALHAMMHRAGVRSIHSSMAKHLALFPADDECNALLISILKGTREVVYTSAASPLNFCGEATGTLRGGNLAVLDGLVGTPFDMLTPAESEDVILFIEDVGEAIYRSERMLRRLALSGALRRYRGIVVGRFTDSRPDSNYGTTAEMLHYRLREWGVDGIPVAFGFPCGHIDRNLPIVEGAQAALTVAPGGASLRLAW